MVTADTAGVLAVVAVVGLELGQKFEAAVLHGSANEMIWSISDMNGLAKKTLVYLGQDK